MELILSGAFDRFGPGLNGPQLENYLPLQSYESRVCCLRSGNQ